MWMYQLLNFRNLICIHSVILYTVQKIWFTRKVKFDKNKKYSVIIVRQNNCINFSVCAQWMIWWLHSIYQFISEFYDNCISIQKASINRYSMVVLIYRLVTSSKLLFRKSIFCQNVTVHKDWKSPSQAIWKSLHVRTCDFTVFAFILFIEGHKYNIS